jgi:hypothetical protein
LAVLVAEDLGLAMTGGLDSKTVLHCLETGKTLKVLELGIGGIRCLYRLGSVTGVSGYETIIFFDMINQNKMDILPVNVECDVICMQMGIKKSLHKNHPHQTILFVGGSESIELTKIALPEEITKRSNLNHYNFI